MTTKNRHMLCFIDFLVYFVFGVLFGHVWAQISLVFNKNLTSRFTAFAGLALGGIVHFLLVFYIVARLYDYYCFTV